MTTNVNLKKTIHRKVWEMLNIAQSGNTNNGFFVVSDSSRILPGGNNKMFAVSGVSAIYNYSPEEDSWMQQPNSGAAGSYSTGSCGEFRGIGAMGGTIDQTATGGTTSTIITNKTITKSIAGCKVRVISGAGVGYEGVVESNTIGTNATLTVTPVHSEAFSATTVFRIWSGSVWFFNAGTSSVGFSVLDLATNAWTAKSVTNLPTSWGTVGQLISTGSIECVAETGTSTGTNTTTTLNNTGKSWQTNGYANYQVRITAGTGAGQIRNISSNTATTLTVSAAWTVTPDATSGYVIEANDDYMYLLGNNAVTLYRYVVSTNTWSTLSPTVARSGGLAAGGTADWVSSVPAWSTPITSTTPSWYTSSNLYRQNGRYIYSFRGGSSTSLDVYDISTNTWVSIVSYGGTYESFTTGSCSVIDEGTIYLQKEASSRIYKFDIATQQILPFSHHPYQQSTTISGDLMAISTYVDGATKIKYLYTFMHTSNIVLRTLII